MTSAIQSELREHHRPGYWSRLGDQLMAIQRRDAERQAKRNEAKRAAKRQQKGER